MPGRDFSKQTEQALSYRVFSGGLNSTANPLNLADNECSDLQNVDFDKTGSVLKRNGYTALNTSAFNSGAAWTSLHFFELSSGTDYLIGTCGNKLAKMDSLDGTWDDVTGALTITAGAENKFKWITFKDIAFGTNNVDPPIKWSGSGNGAAMTAVTGLTDAKWIETWENYVFLANVTISGSIHTTRVYWSAINDPESWDAADFNEVGFKDGQEITGLKAFGERLVIFKERSIWIAAFTGDADIPFTFQKTPSSVGCVSGYAIEEVNNNLLFWAQDGQYLFDGSNSTKLSDRITTTLGTLAKGKFPQIVSSYQYEKNRAWAACTLSGGGTNNRVITWDSHNNAYSFYKGHNANAFARVVVSGEERVYFGDYSGYVYRADTGLDDYPANTLTAIDSYFKTRWFDYGDLSDVKGLPHLTIFYQQSTAILTVAYSYDLEDGDVYTRTLDTSTSGAVWDSAVWDVDQWAGTGGSFYRFDLTGRGRVVRFKYANARASETYQIHGISKLVHLETDV